MATIVQQFLRRHPVFTYQEFAQAVCGKGAQRPNTVRALLAHHIQQGNIVRVRRRLFAAIPLGADLATYPVNPYLIAGYATEDAILAYHSALAFYNSTYSASYRFVYLTQHRPSPFSFHSEEYIGIRIAPRLMDNNFIQSEDVQGLHIRVTSLERTFVDVLDKPALSGGWEEVWRSLAMIERVNIKRVLEYTLLLGKPTTTAKVGFYLSQRQQELAVPDNSLKQLRAHCPVSPYYIDASAKKEGKLISEWNLIIPESLLTKAWEE